MRRAEHLIPQMLCSRLPSCARLIELRRIPIAVLKAILKKHQRFSEMNHTCPVPIQLGWVLRCRVVPTTAPSPIVGAHPLFPGWDGLNNAENFIFYHFIANRLPR